MMSQSTLHDWRTPVSPRSLALWLLSASAPAPLTASSLIERATIFAIEGSAVRVALGRLVREGMAVQPERGVYALGPAAAALHAKARGWMRVEETVRPWGGAWLLVLTHPLGRTDRARLQRRERALRLSGFAHPGGGIWVRADNLAQDTATLRDTLAGLGLDGEAPLLSGCLAEPAQDAAWRDLWPACALEAGYDHWLGEMAVSTDRVAHMATKDAARETYLLGQSVLRAINSDPLLPAELVDTGRRRAMVAAMQRYNSMALEHWGRIG
jgi:phenylacetic acid degradation operon negative regulatory protein